MKWVMAVILLVVAAGCAAPVPGTAVGADTTAPETTEKTTEKTTETTAEPTTTGEPAPPPAPPTAIDPGAQRMYCPGRIAGALGKDMEVVVVATAAGRIGCEQAAAVLVDYYELRPNPDPASDPVEISGFACDQAPEPDEPQVICAGERAALFYSMWVPGG